MSNSQDAAEKAAIETKLTSRAAEYEEKSKSLVAFYKFASFNALPGSMTKLFTGQPLLEEHLQTRYHQGNLWRRSGAGAHRQGQLTMHSGCSCLSDSSNIALRLRALCSPQRWEPAAWRPQAIQSLIAALQTCAEECSTAELCLGQGSTRHHVPRA